jgi:hypothetical protein
MWCNENGKYTCRMYQVIPDPKTEEDKEHNAKAKKDEVDTIKKMFAFFKRYFADGPFRVSTVRKFFTLVSIKYHSDSGGDAEVFKTLNNMWEAFTK